MLQAACPQAPHQPAAANQPPGRPWPAILHRACVLRHRLVACSLLTYEHWHPSFAGFAPAVVEECLGSMSFLEATAVY